jgi:hypothetical protein
MNEFNRAFFREYLEISNLVGKLDVANHLCNEGMTDQCEVRDVLITKINRHIGKLDDESINPIKAIKSDISIPEIRKLKKFVEDKILFYAAGHDNK